MSGDNSVGAIGPIFDPSAQQVHCRHRTFVWVNDIAQVIQNPTLAPDGKKVKFDQRLCGDATVAHLKREIPKNHGDQVRQFSASMVCILSAPHQLRPYSGESENGD